MAGYAVSFAAAVAGSYALQKFIAGGKCTCTNRLDGKTAVITGGNGGIGRETAIDLAKRGACVYIACRNIPKSEIALHEIKNESGSDNVHLMLLDLSSFDSIQSFAKKFLKEEKRLDILVNNAATRRIPRRMLTADGLELQMGVNHFGHFLLTNLLLDRLKTCSPSRVVFVSSLMHMFDDMDFRDLQMENTYNSSKAYCRSKLANILCVDKLHRLHNKDGISFYALHPGGVATDPAPFQRGFAEWGIPESAFYWIVWPFLKLIFKTPKQGAQTTIFCCVQPGLENYSGKYFSDCQMKDPSHCAQDAVLSDQLWEYSKDVCGI